MKRRISTALIYYFIKDHYYGYDPMRQGFDDIQTSNLMQQQGKDIGGHRRI